ncbi:MAG: hypothetical protein IJX16_05220 [Clostridia bacterium]|nr:hypothetical protein [Clostridia bacterium]
MSFSKKVIILKELENGFALPDKKISGIVRIEQTDGIAELYLSTINLNAVSGGTFFLFVVDHSKTVYSFDLLSRPYTHGKVIDGLLDLDKGFSAGLCFVKDDLPITIAFGATEDFSVNLSSFKRLVAETCLNLRRKKQRECEEQAERERFINQTEHSKCAENDINLQAENMTYDDEAVATENFYALNDSINDKLLLLKEKENALLPNENAMPFECDQKEKEKSNPTTYGNKDETDACKSQKYSAQSPYYLTVKNELDEVFCKFPPDKELNAFFADSRWARVKYADNKYYVVGVVKEYGKEKYICYGVPSKYSPEPPETLKDCSAFIPLSVFDLKGDGYWMMFQDAITGNCIKLKKQAD